MQDKFLYSPAVSCHAEGHGGCLTAKTPFAEWDATRSALIGNHLHKPDNLFAWMQSSSITADFILALQEAGTVCQDLDPVVIRHIIEMLSYGQLTIGDFKAPDQFPPF